jgi:hypothetical protein
MQKEVSSRKLVSIQQPHLLCYQSGENAHLPQESFRFFPPCCHVYGTTERFRKLSMNNKLFFLK